jgi:hypothetical protein
MLDEDEVVVLAVLLEELAARNRLDPLSTVASRAATLLRQRVAAGGQRPGIWLGPADPAARREAGDDRDDTADSRDARAGERDHRADERDKAADDRDRLADGADQRARAAEQCIRDLLWNADLHDEAVASQSPASEDVTRPEGPAGRGMTGASREPGREDRQAIRDLLSQVRADRLAARQRRYAAGRDRLASSQDRHAADTDRRYAARDRQAARADRDQAVIDTERAGLASPD